MLDSDRKVLAQIRWRQTDRQTDRQIDRERERERERESARDARAGVDR